MGDLALFAFGSLDCLWQYQCQKVAITLGSHFYLSAPTLKALEVPEGCTVKGSCKEARIVMLRDCNLLLPTEP